MANPPTPEFLDWLADRLVHQYDESEQVDFVLRLREEAAKGRIFREELSANQNLYELVKVDGPHMDETSSYQIRHTKGSEGLPTVLYLTPKQADDLTKQLEAPLLLLTDLVHDRLR